MSPYKLTKDGKRLMKYDSDSLIGQRETQYSDRASKQLAEDVFAKNRSNHELNHGAAPEHKTKSERTRKSRKTSARPSTLSRKSRQVHRQDPSSNPPFRHNTVHAPFIRDYYDVGSLSLRDYIRRSYLPIKQIPSVSHEAMEGKLKALLDRVKGQGTIEYLEWAALPLPQEVVFRERARGQTGLMFEDLVGFMSSRQMDEEVWKEEREKLEDACRRKERELEVLREKLREKEEAVRK
jgi:hypothetical protein